MIELVLFLSFAVFLFFGLPVAFAMGLSGLLALITAGGFTILAPTGGIFYASMASDTLLAIPFFILAGVIMELTGISQRLMGFAHAMVGHRKTGLALVTVIVALLFSSISGSGPATVAAIGSILIPSLVKYGYTKRHSAALVASAGEMGIILPPSIAYIVFAVVAADYERVSISRLFMAGIVPGVLMALAFYIVTLFMPRVVEQAKQNAVNSVRRTFMGRKKAKALESLDLNTKATAAIARDIVVTDIDTQEPEAEASVFNIQKASWSERGKTFLAALPGLFIPVLILGGIYSGVFTPTESAAVSAVYALIVGVFTSKELRLKALPKIFSNAGILASRIMFIIGTASLFSYVITRYKIADVFSDGILSITDNPYILILLVNVILLIAGTFLEAIPVFYLFIPIVVPVLSEAGMDITTIGVMMTMNAALGLITPPIGLDLFVAAGIAKISFGEAAKGIIWYLFAGVVVMLMVAYIPVLSNGLPDLLEYLFPRTG